MADNFDDFEDEFNGGLEEGGGGRSNRPFMLAAGSLIGLLLISLLCYAAFNMFGVGEPEEEGTAVAIDSETAAQATSISATNEAIGTYNANIALTVESMDLTASAPTNTPTPLPPTNTPVPTMTATPSPTATVEATAEGEGEEGEEGEEGGDEGTPNAAATSIFGGLNTATPSSGGSGGTGGTGGTGGSGGTGTGGTAGTGGGTLPQTGISLWEGVLAAVGLLALILVARRLRK
ncbi:MAG: hypothetical protein OT477_07670 [Chloroflexi bacterium]|nr:hypothetical protein [Chloroflexota bacterium]